jgi:hypothetical protein
MSRPTLSLYALDRPALVAFSNELRAQLKSDDRTALGSLISLGAGLAQKLATGPRAVDWLLRPESDADTGPMLASLRRVAKKRALTLSWTSSAPSLEGRLRHYDLLREEKQTATLIDKLLDAARLPWFLVRPGATCGWLDDRMRERLATELHSLEAALPPEITEFSKALREIDGPVIAHDQL